VDIASLREVIQESIDTHKDLLSDSSLLHAVAIVADEMVSTIQRGGRVIFAGNGGSAADAQHLAAEFVSRFAFDRPGLPSISLSTDTSIITAIGNDYGYERVFSRQLEAQAKPGDLFIGISTSGKSQNILLAFEACRKLGVVSVALCGISGVKAEVDHLICVPSEKTPRIQECHILIGHALCKQVEDSLFAI
jgi:D-sedoheptulose 7-phosphate isomerase